MTKYAFSYCCFTLAAILLIYDNFFREKPHYPSVQFEQMVPIPYHFQVEDPREYLHMKVDFNTKIDGVWYHIDFYQEHP